MTNQQRKTILFWFVGILLAVTFQNCGQRLQLQGSLGAYASKDGGGNYDGDRPVDGSSPVPHLVCTGVLNGLDVVATISDEGQDVVATIVYGSSAAGDLHGPLVDLYSTEPVSGHDSKGNSFALQRDTASSGLLSLSLGGVSMQGSVVCGTK